MITEGKHPLKGQSIKGKILVFPCHRGSSGWGGTFISAHSRGNGPLAMIIRYQTQFGTDTFKEWTMSGAISLRPKSSALIP